jgi:drug/metabolite transporter (DMT)-like permease
MGQLFALLNAIFMGIGNVCARKGMEDGKIDNFSGLFITLVVNNILNCVFLLIYTSLYGGFLINFPGLVYNVTAGFLNSFAGRLTLFYSISYIGASRAGVLKVVTPLFAIVGGVFLLKETISLQSWFGIMVVLSGIVFISVETTDKEDRLAVAGSRATSDGLNCSVNMTGAGEKAKTLPGKGLILGLLASFFFAGGNICRKIGVSYIPNPLLSVTIGSLVALLSAVIVQLCRRKGHELVYALKNINLSYLFSGIFTALALYSLFWALELIPISIASSIGATEALFTIVTSMVLLGNKEILNWRVITGALVVISGVVMLIMF